MKKLALLVAVFGLSIFTLSAQKIKKTGGDIKNLKGLGELNLTFKYDDMTVGKNLTEEEYIQKKVDDYNKDERGKGDKWKENWLANRDRVYEPKFVELFNKYAAKTGLSVEEDAESDYTLQVHTYYTEPGWNIGISKKPAYVNIKYIFTENATGDILAEFDQQKIPGSQAAGYDFDVASRISESYAKAGKSLGKYLEKQLK